MKKNKFLCLVLSMIVIFGCISVNNPVEAASKYVCEYDYNSNTIKVRTASGEYVDSLNVDPGELINYYADFSGDVAYYTAHSGRSYYLYSRNVRTKTRRYLKYLGNEHDIYQVSQVYNGNVYITAGEISGYCVCYRYSIKNESYKKIVNSGFSKRIGTNLILGTNWFGDVGSTYPLYVYNTKKKKNTCIDKSCYGFTTFGNNICFAHSNKGGKRVNISGTSNFTIKKYNLNTCKTTVVAKNIRATYFGKITDKYIYYSVSNISNGRIITKYYCYNTRTKKATVIPQSKYKSR